MKITTIKNIEFKNDIFICPESDAIVISKVEIEFDSPILLLGKDHCECIGSIMDVEKNSLKITLVTEQNNIDEFLIFHIRKNEKHSKIKIRFKR